MACKQMVSDKTFHSAKFEAAMQDDATTVPTATMPSCVPRLAVEKQLRMLRHCFLNFSSSMNKVRSISLFPSRHTLLFRPDIATPDPILFSSRTRCVPHIFASVQQPSLEGTAPHAASSCARTCCCASKCSASCRSTPSARHQMCGSCAGR